MTAQGHVSQVDGSVVEVTFPDHALPRINSALEVLWDQGTRLVLEVHQHAGPNTARCVAIQETAGLACGTAVCDTGQPIAVPVGDA
ncbi:MAG: F0F1 ATP synthase subunit beta, partial [Pseudomonadota bacterium]|nr:F0F1 ATP synthase subunit beta [Pseudomonadota bacterium]